MMIGYHLTTMTSDVQYTDNINTEDIKTEDMKTEDIKTEDVKAENIDVVDQLIDENGIRPSNGYESEIEALSSEHNSSNKYQIRNYIAHLKLQRGTTKNWNFEKMTLKLLYSYNF
ncbi:uncharacterized protein LOC123682434 [Harmonia axyridis]|uniref:uncharacterized protein LOC123682434 n=1 Tax=Harmonia axyridis TaxID=115357 RepID=UPI001E276B4F|nr:uncharacterized protein LOC123682434 [Harmonia axyridis]